MSFQIRPLRGFLAIFGLAVLAVILLQMQPYEVAKPIIKEHGPIETASVFIYIAAGSMAIYLAMKNHWERALMAALFIFLMGARELDAHVKFTSMNFAKTRFFISPKVPMIEKVWVTIFLIALVAGLYYFAKIHWKNFVIAMKEGRSYVYTMVLAIGFVPLSKILDSLPKALRDHFHIPVTDELRLFTGIFEEVMELMIPALFLLAMIQFLRYKSKR